MASMAMQIQATMNVAKQKNQYSEREARPLKTAYLLKQVLKALIRSNDGGAVFTSYVYAKFIFPCEDRAEMVHWMIDSKRSRIL